MEASVGGVLGGSLTGIVHLIRRLDRARFAPAVVLYEPKDLGLEGVPIHVLPSLPVPPLDAGRGRVARAALRVRELLGVVLPRARALARVLRRERPDLVYLANGITTNLDGVIAAAVCGLPVLCHEKGLRRMGPIERVLSRWVDTSVGMTEEVTAHLRGHRARCGRFLTVYDGIDLDEFRPGGGPAVRRELGIAPGAPVVGIVGNLQEWKGQHLFAEAVARARRDVPGLRGLVVGGVHRHGAAYAERVRGIVAREGLGDAVLLTGARRDVAACMDAMDVVVHSSTRREPFGRVLIEAMALGRPLIAPAEGGPREIVVDGESGLLVPPRDPAALAAAMVALLNDGARRAAMGRAARARVEAVFDIRQHVRTMETVMDETIARRRPARRVIAAARAA
ncbi:MAG: glycosyltransferase family 4 protein [Candidatus Binatia bacterium]